MEKIRRMKNDLKTGSRREAADKTLSDDRDRNDALTQERRFKADKNLDERRARNDLITANRRRKKDTKGFWGALVVFLLIIVVLATGVYVLLG